MKKATIIEIVTILNIILLLYTGISKIIDYSVFKVQLEASPILTFVAKPIALLLPWIEFAVVLMLIMPRWRLKGLYATLVLMIIFTSYILALFSFSKEMPCSCGGIIELLSWQQHLVFNNAFVLLNIIGIIFLKKQRAQLWNNNIHIVSNT